MAKIKKEVKITLELTPRECELLWEVLEKVEPYKNPDGKPIPGIDDSRYRIISDIRGELVREVDGRNDDEEDPLAGRLWFNP